MHSEFSGRNRSVDFISPSVNEGYYMKFFLNFPEPIVEVNAVVRHFRQLSAVGPYTKNLAINV